MKTDGIYYKLVYEYYETRILYGYYAYGDTLPSIVKICRKFSMAPATVRSALALLEKKRYIKVDARKAAKVIYQTERKQLRLSAAAYFVPRKEGILDLFQSGVLLFEPLWVAGLNLWEEKDWEMLRHHMKEPPEGLVSMPVQFYIMALSALDNGLILNLYWEMLRYIRFPYLANREEKELQPYDMEVESREELITFFKTRLQDAFAKGAGELLSFMEQAENEFSMEDAVQIPFQWDIYHQRPQLRYSLVSRIIREISSGVYPDGSYLPSLPRMAERYQVSVNTIRRTIDILGNLGLTESFQGKGVKVSVRMCPIDYGKAEIQEGLRLYQESLQLLSLTVEQVAVFTLKAVPKEMVRSLADRLTGFLEEGKSYLFFETCFVFIREQCPLAMVKECYGKLQEMLAWGYPFILRRLRDQDLHEEYYSIARKAEQFLRQKDIEGFAKEWRKILEHEIVQNQIFADDSKKK
jgi:DNA-binding FadR family transcriptional regulator